MSGAAADGTAAERPELIRRSALLGHAFDLARAAHAGQVKGAGRPYLVHPLLVAELLDGAGCDEETIAAAILHDVVEASGFRANDIIEEFGLAVGELVGALTDDSSIPDWERRKELHRARIARAGDRAVAIYVADKLANLRDLRLVYADEGEQAIRHYRAPSVDARLRTWHADVEMAERAAPRVALLAPLREELAAFEAERRAARSPAR